jgi:hypothetical protein
MLKWCCSISLLVLSFTHVFSQQIVGEALNNEAKQNALKIFDELYSNQLPISKGVIFRPIDSKVYAGSTYLGGGINKGRVIYNGILYSDVDLVYDLKSANLIHVKSTGEWISLIKSDVKMFTLGERDFINLKVREDSVANFYEVILSGQNQLLAEHSIKIGNYNTKIFRRELEQKVRYLAQNKNSYYYVNSKNDVQKAFKDKKLEVSKFIKNEGLDFNNNLIESIKEVMRYYNKLSN